MAATKMGEFLGDVDVIIIGGGPAASSTALHLLRCDPALAAKSLMLEKGRHPRDKTCGGALTLNAERILSELEIPLNIPFVPIHHVQLVYGQAKIDLPEDGCAKRVIRRNEFDGLLFQTAKQRGFPTMEEIRVQKVIRQPDHLVVQTDRGYFLSQAVIGADGVGAVVRRTPGFGRGRIARLFVAEVPADPAVSRVFIDQVLLIDLTCVSQGLKGYYWEFPCHIGGRPSLSTGIVDRTPKSVLSGGGRAYLRDILTRRGISLEEAVWKAFPIRHFDPREHFSQPRMLLVGDALGSDPLFSEGISQGLEFGRLAAETVSEGFRRRDLSFAGYTAAVLNSRVGKELVSYNRLSRFFYGPQAELFLSMLYKNQELRNLIGCSYAGTQNMHENSFNLAKHLAKYLLHAKRNVREFRAAAVAGCSAPGA